MERIRMSKKVMGIAAGAGIVSILLLAMVSMQYSINASAQSSKNDVYASDAAKNVTEVSITGNASQSLKPDRANISIGAETQEKTVSEAVSKNAQIMNAVINAIKALGIREDQISTIAYNVYPVYEPRSRDIVCIQVYPPPPECLEQVLVGYKVVNNITVSVELDKGQDVGRVIDAAVNAGANQVYGIWFSVSQGKLDEARRALIEKATLDAKIKAESVASALNMRVIGVKNMNVSDGYYPIPVPVYREQMAAATPIIPPSEQSIFVSVYAVFLLE